MRWVGLGVVLLLLFVAWLGYDQPQLFPEGIGERLPQIMWMLMALILVAGVGLGNRRLPGDRRMMILGVAFWGALFVAVYFIYQWLY